MPKLTEDSEGSEWPVLCFSKLPVITGSVKLFCFPFQMGVSKGLRRTPSSLLRGFRETGPWPVDFEIGLVRTKLLLTYHHFSHNFRQFHSLRSKRFCAVREQRIPSPPLPPPFFFWLSPHFPRRQNTENPVPRSFFAPKPYGNACYASNFSTDQMVIELTKI